MFVHAFHFIVSISQRFKTPPDQDSDVTLLKPDAWYTQGRMTALYVSSTCHDIFIGLAKRVIALTQGVYSSYQIPFLSFELYSQKKPK